MAKLLAAVAILAILYLIIVDASTVAPPMTINENSSCKSSETCQEKIQGKDLSHCKNIITMSSSPGNPLSCCGQLGQIGDIGCQCDAIKEILREGLQEGHDIQEMLPGAQFIVVYCRMGTPQGCLFNAALSSIIKDI